MSKAEERALAAYPEDIQLFAESQEEPGKWLPVDENIQLRYGYKCGYEQAEKDLALTWENIKSIIKIADSLLTGTAWDAVDWPDEQKYYEEVLKRFKETKG